MIKILIVLIGRHEKSKPVLPEPSLNDANNTNDDEPPPPGLEMSVTQSAPPEQLNTPSSESQQHQKEEEKSQMSMSEKETKGSADESKHSKKSRDKKKHKKEKKKKRDRKEKKSTSKSNTPELGDRKSIPEDVSLSKDQIDEKPFSDREDDAIKGNADDALTENESKF